MKRVEDFDEATQGHIRKIVFEQRLKMQGIQCELNQFNLQFVSCQKKRSSKRQAYTQDRASSTLSILLPVLPHSASF